MQHERRRHPRLDIPLEADLQVAGVDGEYSVTMQDLSAGGASLLTSFELPVGTDIQRIHFGLPQGDDVDPLPIGVVARVARCRELAGLGGDTQYLVGIQFLDITRELFDVIQQFVFQGLRNSQTDRVPIERPIAIRFDRFDDFVDEVSLNLSTTGMFIQTRDPRPPGAVFKFQFQLGEDFSLIEGRAVHPEHGVESRGDGERGAGGPLGEELHEDSLACGLGQEVLPQAVLVGSCAVRQPRVGVADRGTERKIA